MSQDGRDENNRQLILARRARFVAAALGVSSLTACDSKPRVCLDIMDPERAHDGGALTTSTAPTVCLTMVANPPPETSSADAGASDAGATDAGAGDAGASDAGASDGGAARSDAGVRPSVCLKIALPPKTP